MEMQMNFSTQSSFNVILEQISSDDIMFQLEGVSSLRNLLAMASEQTLHKFPQETFCQKLVALVAQPALMEISNEIKLMAIQCVVSIMDIYPHHIHFLVSLGISATMRETIEQSMGFIDLVEQCIKCCEKVSQESPRDCLKHGVLPILLNMIDFFDKSTQSTILQVLLNVSASCETESDFTQNFLPILPNICQLLSQGVHSEDDRSRTEKITQVLVRLTFSFTRISTDAQIVLKFCEQLGQSGVYQVCITALSNYLSKNNQDDGSIINTTNSTLCLSQQSICNILKVLSKNCQFSYKLVLQLIQSDIFKTLDLLYSQQQDETLVTSEIICLCQNLLPNSECSDQLKETQTFKKQYFLQQSAQILGVVAQNLLPKILHAFSQQLNNELRSKILMLIQQLLSVLPQDLLQQQFDPAAFTKFVQMILRASQPQQVYYCLKTVLSLLQTSFGSQLAAFFVRHGIQDSIKEFTQPEKIKQLDQQRNEGVDDDRRSNLLKLAENEKQRIAMRLQDMKMMMDQLQPGARTEELKKLIERHDMQLQAMHLKHGSIEESIQEKFGERIMQVASQIAEKYLENDDMSQNKNDDKLLNQLKNLSDKIKEQACNSNYDENKCVILMQQLAARLTDEQGITSYEFEKCGLLNSIQSLLTMSATQARIHFNAQFEESKEETHQITISKCETQSYLLRVKAFVDAMCVESSKQLCFSALLDQCHEQLSLAEPVIFRDFAVESHGQFEAIHNLTKSVIINLVFEPESSTSPQLPFNQLQAQFKMSPVYKKREELYKRLQSVALNVQQSDNFTIIENFLLRRIRATEDVEKLIIQTQKFLGNKSQLNSKKVKVSTEIEPLYQRCIDRVADMIDEAEDHETFVEMSDAFVEDLTGFVREWEANQAQDKKVPDDFWKTLNESTTTLIRQVLLEGNYEDDSQQEDEVEHLLQLVEAKAQAFFSLIKRVQKTLSKDVSMQDEDLDADEQSESEALEQSEDVEMTEEQPLQESESSDAEMSDLPNQQPLNPLQEPEVVTLAELLKSHDDVEIVFYFEGKQVDKNMSLYEICKQPQKMQVQEDSFKSLLLTSGMHETRKVLFQIREKSTFNAQRKDSLLQFSEIRQRTKSQVVQEISNSSGNEVVQDLLAQFLNIKPVSTLEQTLRLTKMLHFIHQNLEMFRSRGINFILQQNIEFKSDDFAIATLPSKQIKFLHSKLDSNLQKAVQNPYQLAERSKNQTLRQVLTECPFLFSFDSKVYYMRLVGFMSFDMSRASYFLRQHFKRMGIKQHRESRVRPCEKQKIKIDRAVSLVDQGIKVHRDLNRRAMLEVVFKDEEGTGLGPTLEFYSQLGRELRADKQMWRQGVVDGSLFPKGLQINESNQDQVQMICKKFELAGIFVARSIFDERMIELPLSQLMWDLVLGRKKNLLDLSKLDSQLSSLFENLQKMANSGDAKKLEDYSLMFYDPSDDSIELVKDGKNLAVNQGNLQTYIDLVLDSTFNQSINLQIKAFKQGFVSIMPIELLGIFENKSEIETLVCGEGEKIEWTNIGALQQSINTAHGYHQNSQAFLYFLRYIAELKPSFRAAFIQFMTGSPRLPIGGFSGLLPKLTVVLKRPGHPHEKADQILPSVMTCQNYVKMPDYSSFEVLKERFDLAVREGANNFTLS